MCMCLVLFVVSEIPESKSSEQQVERLYIILSFRPSGDLGWVSSLTDGHATMLRSAVSSGRQVVHRSRRIFVGREVSSAAAAASQSSQSATCQLCERSSVVRYEQNRVLHKIEAQGRVYPVCS